MIRKRIVYILNNYRKKMTITDYVYEISCSLQKNISMNSENVPRSVFNRIRVGDKNKECINITDYQKFKREKRIDKNTRCLVTEKKVSDVNVAKIALK